MANAAQSPFFEPVTKLVKKMEKDGWERRRKGTLAWKCPNKECGKPTLIGFKKRKTKRSRVFIVVEECALCGHKNDTRVFDPKTKKFVKGRRKE